MLKPSSDVVYRNQRNRFRQSVVELSLRPSLNRTQNLFDLGNTFLNRIEVR